MQTLLIFVLCSFAVLPVTSLGREVDPSDPVLGNSTTAVSVLDMEALLNGLRGPQQYKLFTNPDQVQRVADKLFVNKLLAEQARGLGLAEQPLHRTVIEQKVDEYLAAIRIKALNDEPVPDMSQAAKEQYLANPETYSTPTMVRVAHILIRWKHRTGETRPKEEARELINAVHQRLLNGEDFETVALEVSEDPSVKKNKGDLGFFGRGKMVQSFDEAAFALKVPGELSGIIETSFGFHVLKLIERQDGELKPFEDVKDQIIATLETQFRRQRRQDFVDQLKSDSGRVLYEDVFSDYVSEKRALMGISDQDKDAAVGEEPVEKTD